MLTVSLSHKSFGFSLIELMVGIAIFAITMTFGLSSYRVWTQNTKIRTAAESIQNGLQRARSEAVKLNTNVTFTLQANRSWVVASGVPVIDSRSNTEGSTNVSSFGFDATSAPASAITFSNLGLVIANANTLRQIKVDSTILSSADSRELEVRIGNNAGVGSNIRLCDANLPAGTVGKC
jgi:type IV fimbrial biogenesis protein FimT